MEKKCGRREGVNQIGCMWMFISIFGSNHKHLLMDKKHRSKRFSGNNEKKQLTCSCESSQECDEHVETKVAEEKFSEIIKRLISQKEGEIQSCKDLLEAFHVLDSEEDSLLKSLGDSKRVEETEQVSKQEAVVVLPKRKRNFFSKKWRSEERRNRTSQVSKTIVVLKPAPNSLDVDDSTSNKSKTRRTFSRFIIGLIKRRLLLQSAVGKKSCNVHVDKSQRRCVQEKIESKSRKHVSDEEEPLFSEETSEADKEDDTVQTREDSNKIMSGLYIAARKHLSEMLANGDIDVNLPDEDVPRILGKILSLPKFSSPGDSPSHLSPLSQTTEEPETLQCSEDSDKDDDTLFTIDVSVPIDNPTVVSDNVKETDKTEIEPLSSISRQEDGDNQSSNKVHSLSSSPETPPSSSVKMTEGKETATDVQGKLSPVSVLEPLFTNDESSPTTNTRFSSAEMRIQPLCLRFDEADSPRPNYLKTSMDDKELTLAYIESIVKSSGLSWEELLTRPFYSEQLLELESTDDIAFCSTQLCDDKNLLKDCINEVLMDFCENELNPGPWITFMKPEVQLLSDMEVAAKVAQEGVYWHLLPLPSPHTLDQIVKKDMAKAGSWMDLRFDTGWIGSSISELILDELVEEIIRSCRDMVQDQNSNSL